MNILNTITKTYIIDYAIDNLINRLLHEFKIIDGMLWQVEIYHTNNINELFIHRNGKYLNFKFVYLNDDIHVSGTPGFHDIVLYQNIVNALISFSDVDNTTKHSIFLNVKTMDIIEIFSELRNNGIVNYDKINIMSTYNRNKGN
jgi:hypothetical protein